MLARLDQQVLRSQRNEVLAGLDQAKASRSLAEVTLKRLQDARGKGAVTAQSLDEATQTLSVARANVQLFQSQLATLDVQLQKHELIAPFDGTITHKYQSPGAVVGAGVPVLRLQGQQRQLRVSVPNGVQFQTGQSVTIDDQTEGVVYSVLPTRDPLTAASEVLIDLPGTAYLPGEWIRLQTLQTSDAVGWWVPVSALTRTQRGWNVYRVRSGQAEIIPVELIETDGIMALVRGGLEPVLKSLQLAFTEWCRARGSKLLIRRLHDETRRCTVISQSLSAVDGHYLIGRRGPQFAEQLATARRPAIA